jgi:hypothetical protein
MRSRRVRRMQMEPLEAAISEIAGAVDQGRWNGEV